MRVRSIEHVQLAMPPGGEEAAGRFYHDLLGLPERPKPQHLARRCGCWFESDTVKIHLGVEQDFRPAKKATLRSSSATWRRSWKQCPTPASRSWTTNRSRGYHRVYAYDPFGNRLELTEPVED